MSKNGKCSQNLKDLLSKSKDKASSIAGFLAEKNRELENDRDRMGFGWCKKLIMSVLNVILTPIYWLIKVFKMSPLYAIIVEVLQSNRDLVFLATVIVIAIALVIIYYVFQCLILHKPLPFSLNAVAGYLSTMSSTDLPVGEIAAAQEELCALAAHREHFTQHPFSLENMGIFNLIKMAVILPVLIIFTLYVLPICAVIYIVWFLYNYFFGLILPAIIAFITNVIIPYIAAFAVCKIADMIPFFHFSCPDLMGYITTWQKQYINAPLENEKMQYFNQYYADKLLYYEIPKTKYYNYYKEKYNIKMNYFQKFLTRCKDTFYNRMLTSKKTADNASNAMDNYSQNVHNYGTSKWNRFKEKRDKYQCPTESDDDCVVQKKIDVIDKACKAIDQSYSVPGVLSKFAIMIACIGFLYFITFYNVTGKPSWLSDIISPLYRSELLGTVLVMLSSSKNWLMIGLLVLMVVYVLYTMYTLIRGTLRRPPQPSNAS